MRIGKILPTANLLLAMKGTPSIAIVSPDPTHHIYRQKPYAW